ncbi:hypothetical protein L3X38_045195 [Prunus dulcis]|uniref:Uncharacterized protein n=1 Tax=Prunus dulcis TaxID=3755 RepID=A0AAD4V031_PRUDU|nr:hypothetical protein L3X38_045195 [Prunus dulcis]
MRFSKPVNPKLFGRAVSGGMSFIQFCNPNSIRVHFIVGSSLFLGIVVPSYWHESLLPSGVGSSWVFCSSSALGAAAAIVMDYIVTLGDQSLRIDSGRDWWAPLRNNGDINTASFYSFPKKAVDLLP